MKATSILDQNIHIV